MEVPDAAEIREWSKVDFERLGFGEEADLQRLVDWASGILTGVTGRVWETLPVELEGLCSRCLLLLTEQLAFQAQEEIAETAADFPLLSSFSAGPYSESRRSFSEFTLKNRLLNDNPLIHEALFGLMTPEKREEYEESVSGEHRPEFETTEVDWNYWGGRYTVLPDEWGGGS